MIKSTTTRRTAARAGMTLIETTIAMVIVSGLMVAAVGTLSASARARAVQSSYGRAYVLAQSLLEECSSARYAEPNNTAHFGRETGEDPNCRAAWNDVDDYDGWSASPPQDKSGNALTGLTGWRQQVAVALADPNNPSATAGSDLGLKRITVTITDPRGRQTSATALRSRKSILDNTPTCAGPNIKWVGLTVQVGSDTAAAVSIGAATLNRPTHP
jgi:prepilin-type N-terminal cleavage/methylation domain-containing protein